ncbi:hypothetical protein PIB30_080040 [Stylosanthes scabra]|uniref:Uncharacterized protein n=1 Tax=Stylosanthes scabra TaxID=79078 RepID=A0ABU6ZQ63_9FABA|nr:hypothetical protein [Stylosanthes scabra]
MKKGSLQSKKQSKSITLRRGNLFILSTHRRRSPCTCVGSQQAHVPSHVYTTSNVTFTSPSLTHPRIGVEDPRICVEGTLAASNHTRSTPKSFMRGSKLHKTHAYAWKSTHMRGKLLSHNSQHMRGRQAQPPSSSSPRICVEASICVEAIQAQGQVMKTHA